MVEKRYISFHSCVSVCLVHLGQFSESKRNKKKKRIHIDIPGKVTVTHSNPPQMSVKWADHVGNNLMVVQKVISRTAMGPSSCSPESTYEIGFISVAGITWPNKTTLRKKEYV